MNWTASEIGESGPCWPWALSAATRMRTVLPGWPWTVAFVPLTIWSGLVE